MKKRTITGIPLIAIVALSIGVVAEGSSEQMIIHIDVAPNTLNLKSNGNGVTVHTTDIPQVVIHFSQFLLIAVLNI